MATFYVGQRVRIKWSNGWPELNGEVGTIESVVTPRIGVDSPNSEWMVSPDCWGSSRAPHPSIHGAALFAPNSSQLEPATDCYDKCSWDECEWKPEHMRETV